MNDDRLTEIENEANEWLSSNDMIILELISELRSERKVIEQIQSDYTELESEIRAERAKSEDLYKVGKGYENQYTELEKELEAERAKVTELESTNQWMHGLIKTYQAEKAELQKELDKYTIPRPIDDIHEDYGDVLCWNFPVEYSPDIKSCLDLSFKEDDYTHFTLIPNIKDPTGGK